MYTKINSDKQQTLKRITRLSKLTREGFAFPSLALATLIFSSTIFAQSCLKVGGVGECTSPLKGPTNCSAAINTGGIGTAGPNSEAGCPQPGVLSFCTVTEAVKAMTIDAAARVYPAPSSVCSLTLGSPNNPPVTNFSVPMQQIKEFYQGARIVTATPSTSCLDNGALPGTAYCFTPLACPPNTVSADGGRACLRLKPEACTLENPIQCAGGRKWQIENDFRVPGSLLEMTRYYSSTQFFLPPRQGLNDYDRGNPRMGQHWRHSFDLRVMVDPSRNANESTIAYVDRPGDDYRWFKQVGNAWIGRLDSAEKLVELKDVNGLRTGWQFLRLDDRVETYDVDGRLISVAGKDQRSITMTYGPNVVLSNGRSALGQLLSIKDERGREMRFEYDASNYQLPSNIVPNPNPIILVDRERLIRVISPDGKTYSYGYNNVGDLTSVTQPSTTGTTSKQYLYNESTHVAAGATGFALLTGIVNEAGQRYGTYKYDLQGRAYSEFHGSSGTVDRLNLTYSGTDLASTYADVSYVDAMGANKVKKFYVFNGVIKDAGEQWPCSSPGCTGNQSSAISYDANGYRDLYTDRRGNVTDTDFNAQGLEVRRIEAKNTPQARITETVWHSNLRVPIERRICAANINNNCPSTALSPILLSKTTMTYNSRGQVLTQSQIDISHGSPARTESNTYCESVNISAPDAIGSAGENLQKACPIAGLLRRKDGARTDVNDWVTFEYYLQDESSCATSPTTCLYRKGDLKRTVNAAGHVVEYLAYDGAGRVLKMKDPNGVETWMTYHPRGWLLSRTVKGNRPEQDATTKFSYRSFGAIERVTQPDNSFLQYSYDDAQRLISVSDSLNNKVDYQLDNAGNRVAETTKDPNNAIKRSLQRQYDQLSRLSASLRAGIATTDPNSKKTTYTYDANGNSDLTTDPDVGSKAGAKSDSDYDPLNRLIQSIQDVGGINAKVEYSYDALSRLTLVKDPKNLSTAYSYDALGNLLSLNSPDTGITTYTYDDSGNRKTQVDARGVKSLMSYDLLNRLSQIEYIPTGSNAVNALKTVRFFYDEADGITGCQSSFPLGRLTRFTDESGSTVLCYDRRGNVIRKAQSTLSNTTVTSVITQGFDLSDKLINIVYPNGTTVNYTRDGQGRVISVAVNSTSFINNISYLPFGPMAQISFANGKTLTKTFDQNYDIASIVSTANGGLNLDYSTDEVGNIAIVNQGNEQFGLTYDKLYRLKSVKAGTDGNSPVIESFSYDATGNRLSKTLNTAAPISYTYDANSHKLTNVGGTSRSYDANGNAITGPSGVLLTYDERNRLVQSEQAYNARGERVSTKTGSRSISYAQFMFSENSSLLYEHTVDQYGQVGGQVNYVYVDAIPVARIDAAGMRYPIETDHLGTPRAVQKVDGSNVEWRWPLLVNAVNGSNAFGELGPDQATRETMVFPLRFPGQYDDRNGLYYNYFRDYEPGIGRYVESDPIGLRGGMNTFSYAGAAPLSFTDQFGLKYRGVGKNPGVVERNRARDRIRDGNNRGYDGADSEGPTGGPSSLDKVATSCELMDNHDLNIYGVSCYYRSACLHWRCCAGQISCRAGTLDSGCVEGGVYAPSSSLPAHKPMSEPLEAPQGCECLWRGSIDLRTGR